MPNANGLTKTLIPSVLTATKPTVNPQSTRLLQCVPCAIPNGAPQATQTGTSSEMNGANDHSYTPYISKLNSKSAVIPRMDNVVIAMSSGALYDFSKDNKLAKTHGKAAYAAYQEANKTSVLDKGDAFALAEKLYNINEKLAAVGSDLKFDVVITSKNTPRAHIRTTHSNSHYHLPIGRAAFTGGASPFRYAKAFGASLYLTTNPDDAKQALLQGVPAARILPSKQKETRSDQLRVAFDADAVIFSDASERIAMNGTLEDFQNHERDNVNIPLEKGPLYPLLYQLSQLQKAFPSDDCPIRIAITTARSAPANERLHNTLEAWNIEVDELHLLGGKDKGPFLEAFEADLFFDDKLKNTENGAKYVPSAHVHYGVSNE